MDTIRVSAACVTGARHLRAARNGQDAAAAWLGDDAAAVVVCDGCGSGGSSEVGARLGARLFTRAVASRLVELDLEAAFAAARADVAQVLDRVLEQMIDADRQCDASTWPRCDAPKRSDDAPKRGTRYGARAASDERFAIVREHFLFTIVAAAARGTEAAVWVLGDGAYALDGIVTQLGPFADNQPPYLAYDLIGAPAPAHFVRTAARAIVIATDGGEDLDLPRFASERFATHPDALRRELSVLARAGERIDWDARRVVRTPAVLQDDCAVGVVLG